MLVQDYLREKGIDSLVAEFAIETRRHQEYPNLVLFKYSMIDSPMSNPVVQECRGLILDKLNDWAVVSHPFDKFFNESEGLGDDVGSDFVVQEKLDGSLCVLYHYDGQWMVQTSGSPDAGGQVHTEPGLTFSKLFWTTWGNTNPRPDLTLLNHDYNYIFELTSQFNRIVVWHTEPKLHLIGIRNRVTQTEAPISFANGLFPLVKEFPLKSLADITESFRTMNPMAQEGYVIRGNAIKANGSFPRLKTKHPGYVAIHHMRDTLSAKSMLEVIRTGESSEFLTYFPEVKDDFNRISDTYNSLASSLEAEYDAIKDIETQKDFAAKATKTQMSSALFCKRNGKVKSIKEYLATMNISTLMDVLKLKEVKNEDPSVV